VVAHPQGKPRETACEETSCASQNYQYYGPDRQERNRDDRQLLASVTKVVIPRADEKVGTRLSGTNLIEPKILVGVCCIEFGTVFRITIDRVLIAAQTCNKLLVSVAILLVQIGQGHSGV